MSITQKPFIHLFQTPGGKYLFDVNTNYILKINSNIYNKLSECEFTDIQNDKEIIDLKNLGFLSNNRASEIDNPICDVLEYYLEKKIQMATLQVTRNCNLRCSYCTYSGSYFNRVHENRVMDLDLAKRGIDFLINHSSECERVNLAFYGGEPLLEFNLIKQCIEYAEERAEGKIITFSLTTNGTLLTEEIVDYFVSHGLMLTVSLDGNKEAHDKNRRFAYNGMGSFDIIIKKLEMIKHKYPDYIKNVILSVVMDSKNDFGCINEFFINCDIIKDSILNSTYISDDYMKGSYVIEEDFNNKLQYEYFKMYLSKIGRLNKELVSRLVYRDYSILKGKMHDWKKTKKIGNRSHPSGPCIAGTQRLFIDVNGNLLPCEKVSEASDVMKIGHINYGFDFDKVRNIINIGQISQEDCKNCWAFMHCQMCAASADNLTEFSKTKRLSGCSRVKNIVEGTLKDFCVLKELGYDMDDTDNSNFQFLEV